MEQLTFDIIIKKTLFEHINDIVEKVCSKQEVDTKYVSVVHTCKGKGCSIWIIDPTSDSNATRPLNIEEQHTKSADKFVITMQKNAYMSISKPDTIISENDTNFQVVFCIDDSEVFDYIEKLFDFELSQFKPSYRFGCCSRYNECSNVKKCVHPENFYARSCQYRDNLEAGKIFYGENRNI